jgi:hypothetical protein
MPKFKNSKKNSTTDALIAAYNKTAKIKKQASIEATTKIIRQEGIKKLTKPELDEALKARGHNTKNFLKSIERLQASTDFKNPTQTKVLSKLIKLYHAALQEQELFHEREITTLHRSGRRLAELFQGIDLGDGELADAYY